MIYYYHVVLSIGLSILVLIMSLSLSLSIYLNFFISINLCLFLSIYLSEFYIYLFFCMCVCVCVCVCARHFSNLCRRKDIFTYFHVHIQAGINPAQPPAPTAIPAPVHPPSQIWEIDRHEPWLCWFRYQVTNLTFYVFTLAKKNKNKNKWMNKKINR